jgi:hypothetical protein
MMKSAFRTLTVTSGREVVGTIQQKGQRHFVALLPSGASIGTFSTAADAAQKLSNANPVDGYSVQGGSK